MPTVSLCGPELNGLLPDVCVMCGHDADVLAALNCVAVRHQLWWLVRSERWVDLPYCQHCWRKQRGSFFGGHRPRVDSIDGGEVEVVRLSRVSENFVEALVEQRRVADAVDDGPRRLSNREFVRAVRKRTTGSERLELERVRDSGWRVGPLLLIAAPFVLAGTCGMGLVALQQPRQPPADPNRGLRMQGGPWGQPGWQGAGPPPAWNQPVPPGQMVGPQPR